MSDTGKETKLVMRHEWQAYMNCLKAKQPGFFLIGEGFTALTEKKNPKTYKRKYVHEKAERTDVTGYGPTLAYTADCYSGDPCVDEVVYITDNELVGDATHRDIVSVNLFKPVAEKPNTYEAMQRTYAVIPDGKGNASEALDYTGTFEACGDQVHGEFDISTKKFTADGAAAASTLNADTAQETPQKK